MCLEVVRSVLVGLDECSFLLWCNLRNASHISYDAYVCLQDPLHLARLLPQVTLPCTLVAKLTSRPGEIAQTPPSSPMMAASDSFPEPTRWSDTYAGAGNLRSQLLCSFLRARDLAVSGDVGPARTALNSARLAGVCFSLTIPRHDDM